MLTETGKFTPGPWNVMGGLEIFGGADVVVSEAVDDAIVCSMGHDLREVDENSRLIAAAPELLEALEVFVNYMEHAGDKTVTRRSLKYPVHLAKSAIKKAKGE